VAAAGGGKARLNPAETRFFDGESQEKSHRGSHVRTMTDLITRGICIRFQEPFSALENGVVGEPMSDPSYAVVPFVQRGARLVAEDVHYLDTFEQAHTVAVFVARKRPGVIILSVTRDTLEDDPEIVVLEQMGSGLAGATATVH